MHVYFIFEQFALIEHNIKIEKKNCQEWHLIQSTVKYSVKRVIAGKEAAFYKSLYFMNGKTYIKEIFGNSFKHNKTYFH